MSVRASVKMRWSRVSTEKGMDIEYLAALPLGFSL